MENANNVHMMFSYVYRALMDMVYNGLVVMEEYARTVKILFADHALEIISVVHIVLMEQVWLQMAHAYPVILTALNVHITILFALHAMLGMGLHQFIHVRNALILIVPNALLIIQFVKNVGMVLDLI